MAFPNLLPTGENGFFADEPRPLRITPKQYINGRVLSRDSRLADSPEYPFAALDWLEKDLTSQNITITTLKIFNHDISVRD